MTDFRRDILLSADLRMIKNRPWVKQAVLHTTIDLFLLSGLRNSIFRLKEPMMLKRMLHWYVDMLKRVQRFYLYSHRLCEDRSAIIKQCLCQCIIRGITVHLVRVRLKKSCNV